jgi:hypothetical protein
MFAVFHQGRVGHGQFLDHVGHGGRGHAHQLGDLVGGRPSVFFRKIVDRFEVIFDHVGEVFAHGLIIRRRIEPRRLTSGLLSKKAAIFRVGLFWIFFILTRD